MRFKQGELLATKKHIFGTAVWDWKLSRALDCVTNDELVVALNSEGDNGWTRIVTPRGTQGLIHRNSLKRPK